MSSSPNSLAEYVESARQRIAGLQGPRDSSWRELVERQLGDAYARGDRAGLSRVVQLLVHLLESQGRFDDALQEVEAALNTATDEPAVTASLLALKAALVVGRGDGVAATKVADLATELAPAIPEITEQLKTLTLCETVRLQTFRVVPDEIDSLLGRLVGATRWQDQLFLLSWLVPALAALGKPAAAAPHIRAMSAVSRARSALFRMADVAAFQSWRASIAGPGSSPLTLKRELRSNSLADWRVRCLELGRLLNRRDWGPVPRALAGLELTRRRIGGDAGDSRAWEHLVAVSMHAAGSGPLPAPPLSPVTLGNLGSSVATAHAAALGGTSAEANAWCDWVVRTRRLGVESSLEHPVSLRRLQGLLALRGGQPTAARRFLDDAATWCIGAGMTFEAAVARAQALELKQKLFASAARDGSLDPEAASASASLAELGVDPVPHRYAVLSAWDAGNNRTRASILTARECDILQHLARGLSYREVGDVLGIAEVTVKTNAHRIYDKLGVHRRLDALREARRLGLL